MGAATGAARVVSGSKPVTLVRYACHALRKGPHMPNLFKMNVHWVGLNEEGQFGVWVATDTAQGQADTEAAAAQLRTLIAAAPYVGALTACLSPDQAYDKVSVYAYPSGATKAAYGADASFAGSGLVGTGTARNALQCSLVATLGTGHRGSSYRGRIYLPFTGKTFGTNHQAQNADVDAIQAALAGTANNQNLLDDFRRAGIQHNDTSANAVVWSRHLGIASPITSVRVDSRIDIQRRRAGKQVASYAKQGALQHFTG